MSYSLGGGALTPDDMARSSKDSEIRDKAIRWFQTADQEIAALAGHESTAIERSIGRLMVLSELGARMYGDLRKEFGAEAAQGVLKEAFALVGGIMRRNGENVRMRVVLAFDKLEATEPDQPYVAVAKEETCECQRDQDGRCAACIEMMRSFCATMSETVRLTRETSLRSSKSCKPCLFRHMDGVMAEFVRRDLSTVEPESADIMMKSLFMASQALRAMPMPLTTKAWDELLKRRGGP